MKGYTNIEEFDGAVYAAWEVNDKMQKSGRHLIGLRVVREVDSKGEFSDVVHYLVGEAVDSSDKAARDES